MSKDWKEIFLSSGLPLEHDVRQTLEELNISHPSEYKYERLNENGIPITFSTDIFGQKEYDSKLKLNIFIECKYRHDNTKWVFTPDRYEFFYCEFCETFTSLDILSTYKLNYGRFNNQEYSLCYKGVELLRDNSNPKAIKEGIQQLKFAVIDNLIHSLDIQLASFGYKTPIFVLVPIIVTTAELWRIKEGLSINDIRQAKNIEEVAEQKDIVILRETPDNELNRFTREKFKEIFNEEKIRKFNQPLATSMYGRFEHYVDWVANNYPSMYVILNYATFKSKMSNLINFFGSFDMVKTKE
ncbi:MAG: hypothetical protein RIN56_13915 [Sporomusaceae bacterium]|nr:hypothetical protein [Sporomusaceae bacterium]